MTGPERVRRSARRPVAVPPRVDVLVLGGGPAGTWAALAAAAEGATVALVDKGWCGTSGAAAAGGNNLWFVPPEGDARERAIDTRTREGGFLTDPGRMAAAMARTWDAVHELAAAGYPFPADQHGPGRYLGSLQGPEYMRLQRRRVRRAGVLVVDQSPATELLHDDDGAVVGAAGVHRQHGNAPWTIGAGAVVVATGGCAFLSGALGCNVDTGDGALMAAEVGAELSGMEFSNQYGTAPAFGAETKGLMYQFATYSRADGTELDIGGMGRPALQRAMVEGPVYARLDRAEPELHQKMRWSQPNFFLPFDKMGIDPFRERFGVRAVLEGTVRGTGGIAVPGEGCATTVPGLFAAGDAASREDITGGITGGGSHNGAWAISSGSWAGAAAARSAVGRRPVGTPRPAGRAGLRPATTARGEAAGVDAAGVVAAGVVAAVQSRVLPLELNRFRTGAGLRESLAVLDPLWEEVVDSLAPADRPGTHSRQAAAMVAHARWMYRAALARPESRAMHVRDDHPGTDPAQARRLRVWGLDEVTVAPASAREAVIAS
ncbi:FAD-dependent oxidoreductase [Actinomycetospora sp. TBRC 11914]|uniref:FAD-dependent oxidoreductase n=1 Tax=Actinomycetospora sp. TBRC 11914 TaxID=2729387 RepID=UPI00145EDDC4|nr:FAD-binding protein [Actinomycetospora sp. TBRC 11914]NMO91465.1 FAD-binding protein [Actinomycetospora sp. TBRC 11914]